MTARLGWGAGAVSLDNGKVLVAGGVDTGTGHILANAELYDPTTGTFVSTGSMSTPRVRAALIKLGNGKVIAIGGVNDHSVVLSSAELYDPMTGTWSVTGSMSVARTGHSAAPLADGRALVFGGQPQASFSSFNTSTGAQAYDPNGLVYKSAEVYDPALGTFAVTGDMTTPRGFVPPYGATLLRTGDVLVAGGDAAGTGEIYHATPGPSGVPAAGTFTSVGALPSTVGGLVVTLGSGKALVLSLVGLAGTAAGGVAAVFDPTTNTFSAAPMDTIAPSTGIVLTSGDLFSVGGEQSGTPTAQTAVYRAGSGTWQISANTTVVRHIPLLANLPDGRVLVMGGCGANACGTSVLASAEICSP